MGEGGKNHLTSSSGDMIHSHVSFSRAHSRSSDVTTIAHPLNHPLNHSQTNPHAQVSVSLTRALTRSSDVTTGACV